MLQKLAVGASTAGVYDMVLQPNPAFVDANYWLDPTPANRDGKYTGQVTLFDSLTALVDGDDPVSSGVFIVSTPRPRSTTSRCR